MVLNITCIPGDGIGPEIVTQAKAVLDKVAAVYGHEMKYTDILMGGASIDACGEPLTEEAIATAKAADAVLMGSIGGDTNTSPWYKLPPEKRPEAGRAGKEDEKVKRPLRYGKEGKGPLNSARSPYV